MTSSSSYNRGRRGRVAGRLVRPVRGGQRGYDLAGDAADRRRSRPAATTWSRRRRAPAASSACRRRDADRHHPMRAGPASRPRLDDDRAGRACPIGRDIVDIVGYGDRRTASRAPAPTPAQQHDGRTARRRRRDRHRRQRRRLHGCGAPTPRHRRVDPAPTVASTDPVRCRDGALGVPSGRTCRSRSASRSTSTGAGSPSICASTGTHTAACQRRPDDLQRSTRPPTSPRLRVVHVTVVGASVTDQDADDPPDADGRRPRLQLHRRPTSSLRRPRHAHPRHPGHRRRQPARRPGRRDRGRRRRRLPGSASQFEGFHVQDEDADADADPRHLGGHLRLRRSASASTSPPATTSASAARSPSSTTADRARHASRSSWSARPGNA